jgi:hypothetical protein
MVEVVNPSDRKVGTNTHPCISNLTTLLFGSFSSFKSAKSEKSAKSAKSVFHFSRPSPLALKSAKETKGRKKYHQKLADKV